MEKGELARASWHFLCDGVERLVRRSHQRTAGSTLALGHPLRWPVCPKGIYDWPVLWRVEGPERLGRSGVAVTFIRCLCTIGHGSPFCNQNVSLQILSQTMRGSPAALRYHKIGFRFEGANLQRSGCIHYLGGIRGGTAREAATVPTQR